MSERASTDNAVHPYSGGPLRSRPEYGEGRLARLLAMLERECGLSDRPRRACIHPEAFNRGNYLPDDENPLDDQP